MRKFLLGCGVALLTPLVWHGVLATLGPPDTAPPSYLPALERTRERKPFDDGVVEGLRRMDPGFVIIGDSMAGRVEFRHLGHLTHEAIAPVLRNATGSGYWYLAFKNYVVASGVHPKWTLVFFRDTNLTDPMFRLAEPNRNGLDEAARDIEPELNESSRRGTRARGGRCIGCWTAPTPSSARAPGSSRSSPRGRRGWSRDRARRRPFVLDERGVLARASPADAAVRH